MVDVIHYHAPGRGRKKSVQIDVSAFLDGVAVQVSLVAKTVKIGHTPEASRKNPLHIGAVNGDTKNFAVRSGTEENC